MFYYFIQTTIIINKSPINYHLNEIHRPSTTQGPSSCSAEEILSRSLGWIVWINTFGERWTTINHVFIWMDASVKKKYIQDVYLSIISPRRAGIQREKRLIALNKFVRKNRGVWSPDGWLLWFLYLCQNIRIQFEPNSTSGCWNLFLSAFYRTAPAGALGLH